VVSPPPRVGRRGEHLQIRPVRVDPTQVVALAQAVAPRWPPATCDLAGATTEHRVVGVEDEHVGSELRADRAQQPLE
jgi:hypothetical protein